MKSLILSVLALAPLASATTALAQPDSSQVETVYSDAQREADQDLSRRFVTGLLAPSATFENQYAKWKRAVCPNVYGMSASAKYVLERRIRDVAQEVGAPVDRADSCTPNVTIVVTPQPQAALDSIALSSPYLVTGGKKRQLTVTQPIQAWYTTYRRDFSGLAQLDLNWEDAATAAPEGAAGLSPLAFDATIGIPTESVFTGPGGLSSATSGTLERDIPRIRSQGTRLSTGISPEMAGVVVIVDSKAIMGMTLGTLGDYFALLALSPSPATGRCQEAPTIANLMAQGCANDVKSSQLTGVDVALLTGLYQTPEKPEMVQKQRIIGAMRRTLEARYGH
jgi:hypothetical protein